MIKFIQISLLLISSLSYSQIVLEYNLQSKLTYTIYNKNEGILKKISKKTDFKQNTPENIALSNFFAYSNEIASELYLNKDNYFIKDEEDFEGVKQMTEEEASIQLLHKTFYELEGDKFCYVMHIAKIKGTSFPFPTLLPLIFKDGKWYIHSRPNQEKLTKVLKMIKPCVLSNLFEGSSKDIDVERLISQTKSSKKGLNFTKLFDELFLIKNSNRDVFEKITMSKNSNCEFLNYSSNVTSQNMLTSVLDEVEIQKVKKQDEEIISRLKNNNDSIVLTNRLNIRHNNKQYSVIKYERIKLNGNVKNENLRLDNNKTVSPIKELIFLYKNLNPHVFDVLSPNLSKKSIVNSKIYKETRGVYGILNLTKMYDLFIEEKILFQKYLY